MPYCFLPTLFLRILDNEKAETLGSFDVVSVVTEGRGLFQVFLPQFLVAQLLVME
jgi:hypothetical protein